MTTTYCILLIPICKQLETSKVYETYPFLTIPGKKLNVNFLLTREIKRQQTNSK